MTAVEDGLSVLNMHSIAIQTSRFEESFDFYSRVLGLRVVRAPFQFKLRRLAWLDAGNALVELFSNKSGTDPTAYRDTSVGVTHVAFEVPDLDVFMERLRNNGVEISKGPLTPPSGDPRQPRVLFVKDPDGAQVQFREPERTG